MKVTYIFHSGFLVETEDCYYLFDYYRGNLPVMNPQKPIIVFASHKHPDHYNPKVFKLLKEQQMQNITAVLAKDISEKAYPIGIETVTAAANKILELPYNTSVQTLQSTDSGVAFLLNCPFGTIFHAGDLNDWVWEGENEQSNKQMTGSFRHEIQKIGDKKIDIAFFPLDPRQENDYANGLLYFLANTDISKVYPMHYWSEPEIIDRFLNQYPQYTDKIVRTEV